MSAATYYRQKAGMYQRKLLNLQKGGSLSSTVCAVAGTPSDIAAIHIQTGGERKNDVYTGTTVAGIKYPGAHMKGEVSSKICCLTAHQACHVRQELCGLAEMVKCTYKIREQIACKAESEKDMHTKAHTVRSMQFKFAATICWGKEEGERFSIVMERRNEMTNGFCHGRLVCYAASIPVGTENVKCLGNVQFLNKAGDDITMSICSYITGKQLTFLNDRHGVAIVATENIATTTEHPPLHSAVPQGEIAHVTAAVAAAESAEPTVDNVDPVTQEMSQPDVLTIPTPAAVNPLVEESAQEVTIVPLVAESAQDMPARDFPDNKMVETSDIPVDPELVLQQPGAIIKGDLNGQPATMVNPLDTAASDAVPIVNPIVLQTGGHFGRTQSGGNFHHPSFGFSTYHRRV